MKNILRTVCLGAGESAQEEISKMKNSQNYLHIDNLLLLDIQTQKQLFKECLIDFDLVVIICAFDEKVEPEEVLKLRELLSQSNAIKVAFTLKDFENKLDGHIDTNFIVNDMKSMSSFIESTLISLFSIISTPEKDDIFLDLADLKTVLSHFGSSYISNVRCKGDNSAKEVMKEALNISKLNVVDLKKVVATLVRFKLHPHYKIIEIAHAMDDILDAVSYESDVIFGTSTDANMDIDEVEVIVLLTLK